MQKKLKSTRFPAKEALEKADRILAKVKGSAALSKNASASEKFKYELCQYIVRYMVEKNLSQRELANLYGVHESRISEIIHYRLRMVKVDRLLKYVEIINPLAAFHVA